MFIIRKDTYHIKEELKAKKCRWNSKYKCWIFPNKEVAIQFEDFEEVDKLENLPPLERQFTPRVLGNHIFIEAVITNEVALQFGRLTVLQYTAKDLHNDTRYFFNTCDLDSWSVGEIIQAEGKVDFRRANNVILKRINIYRNGI